MKRFSLLVGILVALAVVVPSLASVPIPYVVKPTDGQTLSSVSVSTTPFTAQPGQLVKVDTFTSPLTSITIRLPASPQSGATVVVADDHSNASANPVTVSGNGHQVDGLSSYVIDISSDVEGFVFFGVANEWKRVAVPTNVYDAVAAQNYQVFRASDLGNLISAALPTLPLSEANGGFGANVSSSAGIPINASGTFSFVSTLPETRGGFGADVSSSAGIPINASGTFSFVSTLPEVNGGFGVDVSSSAGIPINASGAFSFVSTLSEVNGGFGANVSSSAGVPVNASGSFSFVAPSTSGNVLTSNGTTWISQAPSSGLASTSLLFSPVTFCANFGGTNTSGSGNATTGNCFFSAHGATVKGVRVYLNQARANYSVKVRLSDTSGTTIATATNPTVLNATPTEIDFSSPQAIIVSRTTKKYCVSAYETTGTYHCECTTGGVALQANQFPGGNPISGNPSWSGGGIFFEGPFFNNGDVAVTSADNQVVSVEPVFQ